MNLTFRGLYWQEANLQVWQEIFGQYWLLEKTPEETISYHFICCSDTGPITLTELLFDSQCRTLWNVIFYVKALAVVQLWSYTSVYTTALCLFFLLKKRNPMQTTLFFFFLSSLEGVLQYRPEHIFPFNSFFLHF